MSGRNVTTSAWLDLGCLQRRLRDQAIAAIDDAINNPAVQCVLLASSDGRWPPTATTKRLATIALGVRQDATETQKEICGIDDLDHIADIVSGTHVLLFERGGSYFSVLARLRERDS